MGHFLSKRGPSVPGSQEPARLLTYESDNPYMSFLKSVVSFRGVRGGRMVLIPSSQVPSVIRISFILHISVD